MKCYKCGTELKQDRKCPGCGMECWKEEVSFLFPLETGEIEQVNAFGKEKATLHGGGKEKVWSGSMLYYMPDDYHEKFLKEIIQAAERIVEERKIEKNKNQIEYRYTEAFSDSEHDDIIRKYYANAMSASYSGFGIRNIMVNIAEKNYFKKQAAENDAMACYYLAGEEKNKNKQIELYQKAHEYFLRDARQGYVEAYEMLGRMYEYGDGVKKDKKQAAEWYHKALVGWMKGAEEGNAAAQRRLADMYYQGRNTAEKIAEKIEREIIWHQVSVSKEDIEQAIAWYEKSASQGDVRAQNELGWIYIKGEGVRQDVPRGIDWLKAAAKQGYVPAQGVLGSIYLYGFHGVGIYYEEAAKWYLMAAKNGNKWAKRELSYIPLSVRVKLGIKEFVKE